MDEFKTMQCRDCGQKVRAKLHTNERELLDGYHGECSRCGWCYWPCPEITKKGTTMNQTQLQAAIRHNATQARSHVQKFNQFREDCEHIDGDERDEHRECNKLGDLCDILHCPLVK